MDFDLDPDEKELFDEINILQDEPTRVSKPFPSRKFRKDTVFPTGGGGDEDDPIDVFANNTKMNAPRPHPPVEFDGGELPFPDMQYQQQRSIPTGPSEGYKTIEDEKADLLNRIARLAKKGLQTSNRLTVYSDIEDIRAEYKRLTYSIEVDQSIKFQRRMLVACVSGIEFLNNKFDPFDLELDGWSENVMENQDDYDGVFEELFQKYRSKVSVAPEIKLMFMVGGSAMMFHLSKSMFKPFTQKQSGPPPSSSANQPSSSQGGSGGGIQPSSTRREMKGPGIDLSSLGGGLDISSLLGTLNQAQKPESVSDIISIGSEVRELEINTGGGGGGGGEKKKRRRTGNGAPKKELVIE